MQVHGEIVDGDPTSPGDVFWARALLGIEKRRGVTDFDTLLFADFHNAVTCRDGGDHRIQIPTDANFGAFGSSAGPAIGVSHGKRRDLGRASVT